MSFALNLNTAEFSLLSNLLSEFPPILNSVVKFLFAFITEIESVKIPKTSTLKFSIAEILFVILT